ncbi:unnamed protein product [Ixodes pacificus]
MSLAHANTAKAQWKASSLCWGLETPCTSCLVSLCSCVLLLESFGMKSLQTHFSTYFLYSSSVLLPILLVQYFQRPCVTLHFVHLLLRNCGTSSACSETRFRKRSKCPTHMSFTSWQLYSLSLYKDTRKFQSIDNIRHAFFSVIIKIVLNFEPNHK